MRTVEEHLDACSERAAKQTYEFQQVVHKMIATVRQIEYMHELTHDDNKKQRRDYVAGHRPIPPGSDRNILDTAELCTPTVNTTTPDNNQDNIIAIPGNTALQEHQAPTKKQPTKFKQ